MIHRRLAGVTFFIAALSPLSAATSRPAPRATEALQLVARFEAARSSFEPAALGATLAPDYEEISPRGDVDTRAQVLGFYDPRLKRPAPAMADDDIAVRSFGDTAIVTKRISFVVPGSDARRSVRARYVARRIRSGWRLISAQYTPMPPAPAE